MADQRVGRAGIGFVVSVFIVVTATVGAGVVGIFGDIFTGHGFFFPEAGVASGAAAVVLTELFEGFFGESFNGLAIFLDDLS